MPAFLVVCAAVATHFYYKTHEPGYEPKNLAVTVATLLAEPIVLLILFGSQFTPTSVISTYALFFSALSTSIVLYRLSPFHPLAKYPGPTINKVSQLWSMWIQSTGRQHVINKKLHDEYGPIVRVGPNELSFIDVEAVLAVFGPGGLPKGRYYEGRSDPNAPGNLLVLHGQAHSERRRLWSRAFTNDSLAEFDIPLKERVGILVEKLAKVSKAPNGEVIPVDLSTWFNYFSVDFMGDFCFGGGFELLRSEGKPDHVSPMFSKFAVDVAIACHVPWAMRTLFKFPSLANNILRLRKFAVEQSTERVRRGAQTKDLWYHLSDEAGIEKVRPNKASVIADGNLAMIAGSDTTVTALGSVFYFLLSNPQCFRRLQEEIDLAFPKGENVYGTTNVGQRMNELVYLNACISEALRLIPPSLTNGPRQVPKGSGGRIIIGHYVPEGTQVYVPPYSVHRNPAHFSPQPDEFVPERWLHKNSGVKGADFTSSAGFTHNTSAFIPFSYGQANCAGRNLARREMALVVSAILQNFDVAFDAGYDPARWEKEIGDYFVSTRGQLMVKLMERS